MSHLRSMGFAIVAAFVGVMACGPSTKEEPRDLRTPCRTYCDRFEECGRDVAGTVAFGSASECYEACVDDEKYQHNHTCGDERYTYLQCTAKPENTCPGFASLWTTEDLYAGPCGAENKAITDCQLEKS